jgi:hypothetical protein
MSTTGTTTARSATVIERFLALRFRAPILRANLPTRKLGELSLDFNLRKSMEEIWEMKEVIKP